ncbi:hypothetical protein [Caulobacter sp.]
MSQITGPILGVQDKAETATTIAAPLPDLDNLDRQRRADIGVAPSYIFTI